MLATSFAVVLRTLLSLGRSLGVFFVLDKLDVRHLRLGRGRDQKEESKDETSEKDGDVKQIRARGGLGHF